jgi:site-specific recombinase XerD
VHVPPTRHDGLDASASALLPAPLPEAELAAELRGELLELVAAMDDYAAAAQAANTTRAYSSDWRQFEVWCRRYGLAAMPAEPQTAALYLTSLAHRGLKLSTVRRRAAAITRAHRVGGVGSPIWDPRVITVLEGIARTHGAAPAKKVALLRDPMLATIARIDGDTSSGLRDRALLLVGFALGLRRSELVTLTVEDLSPASDGIHVRVTKSKTDQIGRGARLLLTYAEAQRPCAVRALRAWLDHSGLTTGPLFRRITRTGAISSPLSAQSVALIVKRRVKAAGLDPAAFAGHSLRSGFATQAARDGHRAEQIADVTRHRDRRVLDGYIQAGRGAADVARVL